MSEIAAGTDDVMTAFRKYCDDRQPPNVSPEEIGYLRHCLSKAIRNADSMGEELAAEHHQLFTLMVHDVGHPELILKFLEAIPGFADGDEHSNMPPEEGADS